MPCRSSHVKLSIEIQHKTNRYLKTKSLVLNFNFDLFQLLGTIFLRRLVPLKYGQCLNSANIK